MTWYASTPCLAAVRRTALESSALTASKQVSLVMAIALRGRIAAAPSPSAAANISEEDNPSNRRTQDSERRARPRRRLRGPKDNGLDSVPVADYSYLVRWSSDPLTCEVRTMLTTLTAALLLAAPP